MKDTNTKTAPKFRLYLRRELSALSYDKLKQLTGISRKKLTLIETNPSIANIQELRSIALVLKKKPLWLLENKELGADGTTTREYGVLLAESNKELVSNLHKTS